ncbi:hypothetical protein [Pseudomonas sp. TNT3]|uniref:hypothetical protein n=1 Tax=Pseudomonas sp. TNT3 TaxID=2654097 RepID=UPI001390FBB8|nr:hypothetical protein [Pseudomonas sp. TNT3]KAI2693229.1 hypothetical protein GBC55_006755 [Pseudomonas sp. TNT3]
MRLGGPDGITYEIGNVASATVISIVPAYKGTTVAGAAYAIMPVQGYSKALADKVRDIVNTYGEQLAALKTTGNYDILPASKGGTGLKELSLVILDLLDDKDATEARETLSAAKSGANKDITALSALTTALSVDQGGTGAKNKEDARVAFGLKNAALADIVGTMAAGAIMEVGTNATGQYIKFFGGLAIVKCAPFNLLAAENAITVSNVNLPIDFVGDYQVIATGIPTVSNTQYGYPSGYVNTPYQASIVHLNGPNAQTMVTRVTCIGFWEAV